MMKVLIAAGGTGGHIYPGIAVAKEIVARDGASEVVFVGTARGLEKRIVPENGFQLALINSAGLKNVGFSARMKGLAVMPKSFLEARRIIRQFRPHVLWERAATYQVCAFNGRHNGCSYNGHGFERPAGFY